MGPFRLAPWRTMCLLVATIALGCADRTSDANPILNQSLSAHFRASRPIVLQEGLENLVVTPLFHLHSDTTILVADPKAVRVAQYDNVGAIVWEYNVRGDSAGSMQVPIALAKTTEGYWIGDAVNGLFLIDSASHRFVRRLPTVERVLQDVVAINDSVLVLAGPVDAVGRNGPSWVRALYTRSGEEIWRAMRPRSSLPSVALQSFSRVVLSTYQTSIIAVHSLLDTLYVFDVALGQMKGAHPLGLSPTFPASLANAKQRPDEAAVADLVRLWVGALSTDTTYVIGLGRGSGTNVRYQNAMGPLTRSGRPLQLRSAEAVVAGRDGLVLSTDDRTASPTHLHLWSGR